MFLTVALVTVAITIHRISFQCILQMQVFGQLCGRLEIVLTLDRIGAGVLPPLGNNLLLLLSPPAGVYLRYFWQDYLLFLFQKL